MERSISGQAAEVGESVFAGAAARSRGGPISGHAHSARLGKRARARK